MFASWCLKRNPLYDKRSGNTHIEAVSVDSRAISFDFKMYNNFFVIPDENKNIKNNTEYLIT